MAFGLRFSNIFSFILGVRAYRTFGELLSPTCNFYSAFFASTFDLEFIIGVKVGCVGEARAFIRFSFASF